MSEISKEAVLRLLPSVLRNDEGMNALAQIPAEDVEGLLELCGYAGIFNRIDELPEELLDILAVDLKVDWYEYDKSVEVKRNQIASSWYIHRKLGTVGAVKKALSDIWPPSSVYEWYEYGGDPYKFRIVLDAEGSYGDVYLDEAVRAVNYYKPARSHIDGYPILRVKWGIVVKTSREKVKYHVPVSGTIPRYSTHGDKSYEDIVIQTEADGPEYHVPITGQVTAGTHPNYSTHGDVGSGDLSISTPSVSVGYGIRKCGTPTNSLF